MYLDAFTEHFSSIEDPRQHAKVSYPLFDIMFLSLCAVYVTMGCIETVARELMDAEKPDIEKHLRIIYSQ